MMTVSERYADISRRTGLSEDIIRSILSATRDSIADSLRREDRATIPGICTFTSEMRRMMKLNPETQSMESTKFVKIKSKPSEAFEQLINTESSIQKMSEEHEKEFMESAMRGLNFVDTNVIRTKQIGALV